MKGKITIAVVSFVTAIALTMGSASAEKLRLLTWGGYAPEKVIEMFKAETGIDVEVTKSNNEDMISKLRATGGSGFDLAQPSQDRVTSAQADFDIYKPLDLSKIDAGQMIVSMLEATKKSTMLDGKVYGVPHVWGTSGLIVHKRVAGKIKDYVDLCGPGLDGKVTYRVKRPTLLGGKDSLWFTEQIYNQFITRFNWELGSAFGFLLLVLSSIIVWLGLRLSGQTLSQAIR